MNKANFFYAALFDLEHPSFKRHELVQVFDGVSMCLESEHFQSYDECATNCNQFFSKLTEDISKLTNQEHQFAWEINPKRLPSSHQQSIPLSPSLTSINWKDNDIIRIYVFPKTDNIQIDTSSGNTQLKPLVRGILHTVQAPYEHDRKYN